MSGVSKKLAAGTLLYRQGPDGLEVLLVHPSGNYNRHKPWSLPKGEPDPGETDLEVTARRETLEEAGVEAGPLVALGFCEYRKSKKRVYGFAGPLPESARPRPVSWEIDQVEVMPLDLARTRIHPDQAVFLDRLVDHLRGTSST
jgi:predicted NUDIX family NTP pyrophosphohydrolase